MELLDLFGKTYDTEVLNTQEAKENYSIHLKGITSGIYILSATGTGKLFRVKVIVN